MITVRKIVNQAQRTVGRLVKRQQQRREQRVQVQRAIGMIAMPMQPPQMFLQRLEQLDADQLFIESGPRIGDGFFDASTGHARSKAQKAPWRKLRLY